MPVRAAVRVLAVIAAATLGYGIVKIAIAVLTWRSPGVTPGYNMDRVIIAGVIFFVVIGYGAAAYGVNTGRRGARQLGLLMSVAFMPVWVMQAVFDFGNLWVFLAEDGRTQNGAEAPAWVVWAQLAECVVITMILWSALLGWLILLSPVVASHLARGVAEPPEGRVQALLRRTRAGWVPRCLPS